MRLGEIATAGLVWCLVLSLALVACSEGRWVHSTKTEDQAQQDWDICKSEVLSGVEHQKEMLAGGVNVTGCMRSKGYTYVEDQTPRDPGANTAVSR
jgi:hypothetical protein